MNLAEKLSKIQSELHVGKEKTNKFAGYKFRSAEDILESLKPFNTKYGVYFLIREELIGDALIKSEATIFDFEGQSISSTAIVGVDLNQKGMAKAQQYGSASSYGKKYALGNLLLIDDSKDADATNDHKGKETLVKDSAAYKKVVAALKGNIATVPQVETKYTISSELRAELSKF